MTDVTETKVKLALDPEKLKKQIKNLTNLYNKFNGSRMLIDDRSDDYGNPSREADSFYFDVDPALKQLKNRYEGIETRMNRIIQVNSNGIGKRDSATGVITLEVPEVVDSEGTLGFDVWS